MSQHSLLPRYRAQLLRMWSESPPQQLPIWRFSLEDIGTGERYGFANLDALIDHLLAQMERPTDQGQVTQLHP
jgi:hypothetical protein